MKISYAAFLVAIATMWTTPAFNIAQDEVVVETVVEGLNNPSGIAIQPETGHVFVADSGALRIIRVIDGKARDVIIDFPKDAYGKGPIYDIGPLGLLFLDKDTLVVGGGGKPDGKELIRVYKVPSVDEVPLRADETKSASMALVASGDTPGEGNFYALAHGSKGIYVTCNGDDTKGWVSLATLKDGNLESFERKIATKEATNVDAPVGITMSPEGHVTVGQMGEINVAGDSLLTFYNEEGELLGKFETGLNDITGLAYGPQHGRLFVTDFNWRDTNNGGLYKLVAIIDDYETCKAVKIAKLRKPTALAFTPEGDLYITLAGDSSEAAPKPDGKLVLIRGLDVDLHGLAK